MRAELLKLLKAPRAGEIVAQCCEAGLFGLLTAGAGDPARLRRLIEVERVRGAPPDPLLRLAALEVRIIEDAERLRDRLRLSNAEFEGWRTRRATLEGLHGLSAAPPPGELRALLFERKRTAAQDAVTLAHVDSGARARRSRFSSAYRFVSDTPEPSLPFTGADIVARGVKQGHRVGATLKSLQALWIRAGFPKEPEHLARLMDEALTRKPGKD